MTGVSKCGLRHRVRTLSFPNFTQLSFPVESETISCIRAGELGTRLYQLVLSVIIDILLYSLNIEQHKWWHQLSP